MARFRVPSLLLTALLLVALVGPSYGQPDTRPISETGLLTALRDKALSSKQLIDQVQQRGVTFELTPAIEQKIREAGKYLGLKGLNDLIDAVRENPRVQQSRPINPLPVTASVPGQGTELVGIDTGVKAHVLVVAAIGSDSCSLALYVTNKSTSATITNIGFIVKLYGTPERGKQIPRSDGKPGPGNYELVTKGQVIETRDFIATSAFSLLTATPTDTVSSSFKSGFVESGIPPGETALFRLTAGSGFFGYGNLQVFPVQIERGVVVVFQTTRDRPSEVALFPDFAVLYSTSEPLYRISKHP